MNIKKSVLIILAFFVVLAVGLWFWSSAKEKNAPGTPLTSDIILFYGKECPHCKDLEKYIEDNQIAEKVGFDSLEVWHNKANSEIMLKKARECGFAEDQLGVPFVYARGKCFIGGPESEKFFKQEAGV